MDDRPPPDAFDGKHLLVADPPFLVFESSQSDLNEPSHTFGRQRSAPSVEICGKSHNAPTVWGLYLANCGAPGLVCRRQRGPLCLAAQHGRLSLTPMSRPGDYLPFFAWVALELIEGL